MVTYSVIMFHVFKIKSHACKVNFANTTSLVGVRSVWITTSQINIRTLYKSLNTSAVGHEQTSCDRCKINTTCIKPSSIQA